MMLYFLNYDLPLDLTKAKTAVGVRLEGGGLGDPIPRDIDQTCEPVLLPHYTRFRRADVSKLMSC